MKWSILTFFLLWTHSPASIQVSVCNPKTLENYPQTEIMTGTKLAIVVSSDHTALWSGSLFIEHRDRSLGVLSGRSDDPNSMLWTGSCLPAAGAGAAAVSWKDSIRWGFDLYTDDLERQAGKWFVVDYEALQPGYCQVAFYDHGQSWEHPDPNDSIVFFNTRTRDLHADGVVNYADFAIFASHWETITGVDPNDPNLLSPSDFNMDGGVDLADLCMFSDYWMYGVPGWQPVVKVPAAEPAEPNVTYSLHSADMLSEITLAVGESITLYIDKMTDEEDVYILNLEAMLSDPNLGWIDNTAIDPNNPAGSGTAQLLFDPRLTLFDYWGPGQTQTEGIEFLGLDLSGPIEDGAMASFVYTATAEGTVELQLADYVTYSNLENIVIHQVAPAQMSSAESTDDLMTMSAPSGSMELTADSEIADPEEMADFLDGLYETEEALRQTIDENSWNEFVDSVRNYEELTD